MYLNNLSLINFRNYRRLEIDFPRKLTLLQGGNAQGKTNLLEALFMLATSRSPHARMDRQLIHWDTLNDPMPFARLVADVKSRDRSLKLELTIAPTDQAGAPLTFRKHMRINGVPKRAMDLVGEMLVVLFLPQDVDLVSGPPAGRRRYLDVALCQIDRQYCQHLAHYNRILPRRNSLLRQLSERGGDPSQLDYWDEQLALHGGPIMARRQQSVQTTAVQVHRIHAELTGCSEDLRMVYLPSFPGAETEPQSSAITAGYAERLGEMRSREIAAGMTLLGPHRDDLRFDVGGRNLQESGSRGQLRTAAMALKLAEAELMTAETGQSPILLLDDVMSELDSRRRDHLSDYLLEAPQAIVTTTDLEDFAPELVAGATLWNVVGGALRPMHGNRESGEEDITSHIDVCREGPDQAPGHPEGSLN